MDKILENQIELAMKIAKLAHEGQTDKCGIDYFQGHIMSVYNNAPSGESKIIALLHDVVEDTNVTMDELRKYNFSDEVYETLLLLTRTDDMTYGEYISRMKQSRLAIEVKLADLKNNMDKSRIPNNLNDTEKFGSLMKRYVKAKKELLEALKILDNEEG